LLILGIGVQTFTFISCTLHFPEENIEGNISSSSAILGSVSSSSKQDGPSSSSSAENQPSSSGSDFENSSSSIDDFLSSSGISSSSDIDSSSSSSDNESSSSSLVPSSSSSSAPPVPCTAKDNTETHYCYYFDGKGTLKEYGKFTYDGQTYKTVEINNQTWMAQNLNYAPSSGRHRCYAQGNGNGGDTWLAPDKPADQALIKANCDKYGRLYDWATAMTIPSSCNTSSCSASQIKKPHRGICPDGWHIPDTLEWNALKRFVADEIFENYEDEIYGWDVGTKLKALTGWKETSTSDKGVDSYGFSAIGTGYCVSCEELSSAAGYFSGEKEEAHWWSATEYTDLSDAPKPHGTKAYKTKIAFNKKVMNLEFEKKADYLFSVRCIKN